MHYNAKDIANSFLTSVKTEKEANSWLDSQKGNLKNANPKLNMLDEAALIIREELLKRFPSLKNSVAE